MTHDASRTWTWQIDELYCMLAQLHVRRGEYAEAQSAYRQLGNAGTSKRQYGSRVRCNPEDWPKLDETDLNWVHASQVDPDPIEAREFDQDREKI